MVCLVFGKAAGGMSVSLTGVIWVACRWTREHKALLFGNLSWASPTSFTPRESVPEPGEVEKIHSPHTNVLLAENHTTQSFGTQDFPRFWERQLREWE